MVSESSRTGFFFFFVSIVLWISTGVETATAQIFKSPVSWHHIEYDARNLALGQSSVALSNGSAFQTNPAVPSEKGILSVSGFWPGAKILNTPVWQNFTSKMNHYNPAVSYSTRAITFSGMVNISSYRANWGTYSESVIKNSMIRIQVGYELSQRFYIGAGLFRNSLRNYQNVEVFDDTITPASAWGVSAGGYYTDRWELSAVTFTPQIGLSLNNISNGLYPNDSPELRYTLPGQVRLGLGFDLSSTKQSFARPLFGGGIYTGFSKYLSRAEFDRNTESIHSPNGFEALFTGWNSFSWFDGSHYRSISLADQISTAVGAEIHLLKTLFIRYGMMAGGELWVRPQTGIGTELDLYYVSFAFTHVSYSTSAQWTDHGPLTFFETTIRIPMSGKERDSLLGRLF